MTDYTALTMQNMGLEVAPAYNKAFTQAIIEGRDIPSALVVLSNLSMKRKLRKGYDYFARRELKTKGDDTEVPNDPNAVATYYTDAQYRVRLQQYLTSKFGAGVSLKDYRIHRVFLNPDVCARMYMQANMGYTHSNRKVATHPFGSAVGDVTYVDSIIRGYMPAGNYNGFGAKQFIYFKDSVGTEFELEVSGANWFLDGKPYQFYLNIYLDLYYVYDSNPTEELALTDTLWLSYEIASTYPPYQEDILILSTWWITQPTVIGIHKRSIVGDKDESYYPRIVIRNDNVNTVDSGDSIYISQTRSVLKDLSLDLDTLTDATNQNPDLDKLQDCYIAFGVNPHTDTDAAAAKYCFKFFQEYKATFGDYCRKFDWDKALSTRKRNFQRYRGLVGDSMHPHAIVGYQLGIAAFSIRASYIDEQLVVGTFGSLGSYRIVSGAISSTVVPYIDDYDGQPVNDLFDSSLMYFEYQEGANLIRRITVAGYQSRFRNGSGAGRFSEWASVSVTPDNVFIPLMPYLIETYFGPSEVNQLIGSCCKFINFYVQSVSSPSWGDILLGLIQMGIQEHSELILIASILSVALTAGSFTAFLYTIGEKIITTYFLGELTEYVVNKFGIEGAAVLALISVGLLTVNSFGGISFEGNKLLTANNLLGLVSKTPQVISEKVQEELEEIGAEFEDYSKLIEGKLGELQKLSEDLFGKDQDSKNRMDTLVNSLTPTEFYDLKIHSGNIGVGAVNAVHSFVDASLKLPRGI